MKRSVQGIVVFFTVLALVFVVILKKPNPSQGGDGKPRGLEF